MNREHVAQGFLSFQFSAQLPFSECGQVFRTEAKQAMASFLTAKATEWYDTVFILMNKLGYIFWLLRRLSICLSIRLLEALLLNKKLG